jgi:hypothetical protein
MSIAGKSIDRKYIIRGYLGLGELGEMGSDSNGYEISIWGDENV